MLLLLARVCLLAAFVLQSADGSTDADTSLTGNQQSQWSTPWLGLHNVEQYPAVEAQTKSNSETVRETLLSNFDNEPNKKQLVALRLTLGFISNLPRAKHFELCQQLAVFFSLPEPTLYSYLERTRVAAFAGDFDFEQLVGMNAADLLLTHICDDYYDGIGDADEMDRGQWELKTHPTSKSKTSLRLQAAIEGLSDSLSLPIPNRSGQMKSPSIVDETDDSPVASLRLSSGRRKSQDVDEIKDGVSLSLPGSLRLSPHSGFSQRKHSKESSLADMWEPINFGAQSDTALTKILEFHLAQLSLSEEKTSTAIVSKSMHKALFKSSIGPGDSAATDKAESRLKPLLKISPRNSLSNGQTEAKLNPLLAVTVQKLSAAKAVRRSNAAKTQGKEKDSLCCM